MQVAHSEPYKKDPKCEIRLGVASWDDGGNTAKSIKFTWFREDGRAARGGEIPVEALPQALTFAISKGYLSLMPEGNSGGTSMEHQGAWTEERWREELSPHAISIIETYLQDLAINDKLGELARSRDALMSHYRSKEKCQARVTLYVLGIGPDFSLELMPDGGVELKPFRGGHIKWTKEDLLKTDEEMLDDIKSRAEELARGSGKIEAPTEEEWNAYYTQAFDELQKWTLPYQG